MPTKKRDAKKPKAIRAWAWWNITDGEWEAVLIGLSRKGAMEHMNHDEQLVRVEIRPLPRRSTKRGKSQ